MKAAVIAVAVTILAGTVAVLAAAARTRRERRRDEADSAARRAARMPPGHPETLTTPVSPSEAAFYIRHYEDFETATRDAAVRRNG